MGKYVVYKIIYSGENLPPYYIGSTKLSKLKNGYLGSVRSKKWKNKFKLEVLNGRGLFDYEILSEHDTRESALLAEYNYQKENDVVNSNLYFNESLANVNGFFGRDVSGEINPMYGRNNEVIAINVMTGEKCRVTKEEFNNNCDLSGHTTGLVSVIELDSGDKKMVSKSEYYSNPTLYKHYNDGKKHSKQTKDKLSEMRKDMITAKDWFGNFHRVYKDDIRFKIGEFGNTNANGYLLTDLYGNEFKTMNLKMFCKDNGLQFPRPEQIIDGIIRLKGKPRKYKSMNNWKIKKTV